MHIDIVFYLWYNKIVKNAAGNLVCRYDYAFTTDTPGTRLNTLYYDMATGQWKDQLDSYNGYAHVYDKTGNLIERSSSFGDGIEYYQYAWSGRQLTSVTHYDEYHTGEKVVYSSAEYAYNRDGIRISKTVDGVKHDYILNGSQILGETWTQNNVEYLLVYIYDANGAPVGLKYRTSNFSEGDALK